MLSGSIRNCGRYRCVLQHPMIPTSWRHSLNNYRNTSTSTSTSSSISTPKEQIDIFKVLEVEKSLERVRNSVFVNEKADLILQHPQIIDIYDLQLDACQCIPFFNYLVQQRKTNFNSIKLLGMGKLLKLVANTEYDGHKGVDLIKNCGILDTNSVEDAKNIFVTHYNEMMRLVTIDILLANGCYREAYEFMQLCENLPGNASVNPSFIKFKFKLSRFEEFRNIVPTPKELIDNDLIHIYLREIMKLSNLPVEKALEYFLLVTFKFFELRQLQHSPPIPSRVIHPINTIFLSLLQRQHGISFQVYLAYFIKLFPQSIRMLKDLKILRASTNKSILSTSLEDLPQVNICDELILKDSLPYMEDLALLYEKFLDEKYLTRNQLNSMFKIYLQNVTTFQAAETVLNTSDTNHPFSKYNHDPSILSKFINYAFNQRLNKLYKPMLTSNMILKFYESCRVSAPDIYKSKTHRNHIKQLNQLVEYFIDVENPKCNLDVAMKLIDSLSRRNINLNSEVYLKLLDSLTRLAMIGEARKVYDHISETSAISRNVSWKQLIPYAYRFKWNYPTFLLAQVSDIPIEKISLDHIEPDSGLLTYSDEILVNGPLKPELVIAELDEQISQYADKGVEAALEISE